MIPHDVRKTNDAIDRLLEVTTNPRHRFLLQAYHRHRFLEISGRYDEIFAPDMMCDSPVYHFHYAKMTARVVGADVKGLYAHWAQTNQTIFYAITEEVAVADHYVASVASIFQQRVGAELASAGFEIDDPQAYYLYRAEGIQQIWPYDEQGRLVGEDVWEPKAHEAVISKLDPADVLTTARAAELLAPLIKPLPKFDPATMSPAAARGK